MKYKYHYIKFKYVNHPETSLFKDILIFNENKIIGKYVNQKDYTWLLFKADTYYDPKNIIIYEQKEYKAFNEVLIDFPELILL